MTYSNYSAINKNQYVISCEIKRQYPKNGGRATGKTKLPSKYHSEYSEYIYCVIVKGYHYLRYYTV